MQRIALVTGGTRGIGRANSVALKEAGHRVAANYAGNDEAARKFVAETGIAAFKFDVANFEACWMGIGRIEQELGPIEILVNNTSITRDAMPPKMTPAQWNEVIATDLGSCFNTCRLVVEGMRDRGFGRIVNIYPRSMRRKDSWGKLTTPPQRPACWDSPRPSRLKRHQRE